MKTTTAPASRFGWEGQTLEYTVRAEDACTISAPSKAEDGLKVRVLDTRQDGNGLVARVAVDVAKPVFY